MQTPVAISASILAILLWLLSRRRPLWPARAGSASAAADPLTLVVQPRAQASLLGRTPVAAPSRGGLIQLNPRQRLLALGAQLNGPTDQRLLALAQLSGPRDRSVLPLLRRALRDPDLKVMGAAAAAIEPYRTSAAAGSRQSTSARRRLPRNAAPRD